MYRLFKWKNLEICNYCINPIHILQQSYSIIQSFYHTFKIYYFYLFLISPISQITHTDINWKNILYYIQSRFLNEV